MLLSSIFVPKPNWPKMKPLRTGAERLHNRLFSAIREMFKRDFERKGRAYAALCIDMNATLLSGVRRAWEAQELTGAESVPFANGSTSRGPLMQNR